MGKFMGGSTQKNVSEKQVLSNLIELLSLLHAYRKVERTVSSPMQPFPENDVEHSFEMAMLAWFVADTLKLDLDREKLLRYGLIHDIVEVYAGDTFSFDKEARKDKKTREHAALDKLESEWGDKFPSMIESTKSYELRKDPESKFIYALDKIIPAITVHLNKGDPFWKHFKLSKEALNENKLPRVGNYPELLPIWHELFTKLDDRTF